MTTKKAPRRFSNVIGFDDAPFLPNYVGNVKVVGTVFARLRLNGVLIGEVEKDGDDAAEKLVALIAQSKFYENIQLVMLQGIALAGFNVVDVYYMHEQLELPILVISRKLPNMAAIRDALLAKVRGGAQKVRGGAQKWALLDSLGPMEPVENIYVQRIGLTLAQATATVRRFTVEGLIPEPLRTAHLIAGAIVNGESRGRV